MTRAFWNELELSQERKYSLSSPKPGEGKVSPALRWIEFYQQLELDILLPRLWQLRLWKSTNTSRVWLSMAVHYCRCGSGMELSSFTPTNCQNHSIRGHLLSEVKTLFVFPRSLWFEVTHISGLMGFRALDIVKTEMGLINKHSYFL